MARNHEKNYGRLNRLWLAEKGEVKKEKRPKLSSLKTAEDVSQWLPSIKDELDFFLKQTEVPCYTENKINECRKRIMHLEAEYKAFVRKLHQIDSKRKTIPWTARPYEKKEQGDVNHPALHPMSDESQVTFLRPFQTPVLTHDALYQDSDEEVMSTTLLKDYNTNSDNPLFESGMDMVGRSSSETIEDKSKSETCRSRGSAYECGDNSQIPCISVQTKGILTDNSNLLGLDYSSSSED